MDIRKVHILIEQKLQQVGVFAYDDFEHQEIDLQIDEQVFRILKSAFNPIRQNNQFQYNQGVLDRIRVLQKTEVPLSVTEEEDYVITELPEDYIHSIRLSANVFLPEKCTKLKCNRIEANKVYKLNKGRILYNNIEYNSGDTFIGVEGEKEFQFFPDSKNVEIVQIKTRKVACKIGQSDLISDLLENSLSTTRASKPLAEIEENNIRVYFSDFAINNLIFSYIRTPSPVNFNFQRYNVGDSLEPNTKYEVIKETVSYQGTTYGLGQVFTTTSSTSFTGTGVVKKYQDGDLNLPLPVCYDVINGTVQELAMISEQNQQKIANLVQTDNVPS